MCAVSKSGKENRSHRFRVNRCTVVVGVVVAVLAVVLAAVEPLPCGCVVILAAPRFSLPKQERTKKKKRSDSTMRGDDDTDLDDVLNSVEQMTISETRPPAEDPNPDLTNAMFARELNKLSMKERDDVLQDVHGISDVMREDPEMVARSLEELDVELGKVEDKEAYLIAKQQNHAYVTDSSFVTMFLRAESFQAKRAATRMSSFFEMKRELFGADKLGRDITIDDLNEDDIKVLESGYVQVLQNRDRAGRVIFFLLPAIRAHKTVMNKVRAFGFCFCFENMKACKLFRSPCPFFPVCTCFLS